ncbi:ABC transporter permease [candidate division KSB1 bacterium]|nr:ABC transporter permease [candidate division KSB1 bacterium]
MFKNYIKTAIRNILGQKTYSLINIAGLSLGMACSILIMLWVQDELNYDRFHKNADSIYRVVEDQYYSDGTYHVTVTPFPVGPAFKEELPEVIDAARLCWNVGFLMRYGDKAFFETGIRPVDPSFLDMFTFPFVRGDAATAFENTRSIVITEEMAQKYFGNDDPMGKIFSANNKYDFVVTGVMTDVPPNSSLEFDMLIPFEFTKELGWYNERWGSNSIQTYVQVEESSDITAVNKKMTEIVHSHNEESTTDFLLAPLVDMHLHSYWGYGHEMGNIQYVYIFGVVALFVLLLACINFMNLSTARSANRAKEIGLRKVCGALRSSIAGQFLGESILMAFAALVFAILLVSNLLPLFNHISGKEITSAVWAQPDILIGLVVITLLTGIIAGSYPALFLSGFEPVRVLKGKLKSGAKSSALRKGLVVAQFALSVMLMIGTAVVYNQFVFMKNKNLGYDKEHVLYIRMRGDIGESYQVYKNELLKHPQILDVTASRQQPASIGSNSSGAEWDGKDPEKEDVLISFSTVDYDYVETLKIEMVQGRSFSPEFPSDLGTDSTGAFVVNEEMARIMGVEPIVGANLSFMGQKGKIIGVMKDFHYHSVRTEIMPLALALGDPERLGYIGIRIQPGDISVSTEVIRDVWDRIIPNYPIEFKFLDQELDRMYRTEERMVDILKYFAILAVFISCLGLFGLASYMAEQRTKEIGVRKVLGATVTNIVMLLSTEFARWVLLANLVAWPVAYVVMTNWLQKFAYRVELGWLTFIFAGVLALVIALLTVSSQALKSAVSNPAEALRYE